jgi:CHAT domain-containing protein/lipopolysaccharide biosynthesis regulator YciM
MYRIQRGDVIRALLVALALWFPAVAAEDPKAEGTALTREALALYQDHRYAEAEPLFKRALAIMEETLGRNDLFIATMSIFLAERYREQNRYAEVAPLYLRAVEIQEKALGPEHLDVAKTLNTLAAFYLEQGNYAEAERLHQRVLTIREKVLGPDHPEVAASLNNLAGVYRKEGHNAEARPLYERALAVFEKALNSDDPEIATILTNLAALDQDEGRYAEAEPLYARSLAILEKALGSGHPNVATCLNNLGTLYQSAGRYADAEPLYSRALKIREEAFGSEHPDVAESLNNLAALYRAEGRYGEAEPLYRRALATRERAFGPDHPDIAYSLNNLAAFYQEQGRITEAETLLTRALAILERALGPDHADVANSLNNLAELYRNEGRYTEAEPLYKRALPILEMALGRDHPDIARILNNLGELYRRQGLPAEAEAFHKRALAIREKALGPDHPDVAHSLTNLAALYWEEGRYAEAEPLHQRALGIFEKALGADHPYVANSLNSLAALYSDEDRGAEAEPLYQRALAIREKALGPDHPDVANSLNNLADLYRQQGRYTEAEELNKRALAIWEKALGPDHLDVANSLNNLARIYLAEGQVDRAQPASARAVDIAMKHLSIGSAQRSGAAITEQRQNRYYFLEYITIADAAAQRAPERRQQIAAETFRVAQMAQTSRAGTAVAALSARLAAGGGDRSEVIREREDLAQQWQLLDSALVKAVSRPPADRKSAEEASLRSALADVSRRLDDLDARITAEFRGYGELSNPKPMSAEAARALLASDEGLLLYLATDDANWVWVLRRDTIAFYRIEMGAKALADEVTALRASLEPQRNPHLAPFPARRAYALYEKLIGPAEPLLTGLHSLLVVPDGALQSLPMAVLVTRPSQQDPERIEDHRNIAWLAHDYAVTMLPAVSSLRALREFGTAEHASAPFLGIGNPMLSGAPERTGVTLASLFRGATADPEKVRALPPLPETATELHAIAKTLGASEADLLLGARASEPVLRQMPLDRYRVIEFATHGLMSGELKGLAEPALVLTPPAKASPDDDGLLTASKIATLKLNADWVVLSACNTAAGDGTPDGGGLSGLAKAFFYAGARSLLVSHWPAWSDATVKLTTGTFAELASDPSIGRAEALRRAMMAMLDRKNPPKFAHPLAWAPFVLAGEGGAGR